MKGIFDYFIRYLDFSFKFLVDTTYSHGRNSPKERHCLNFFLIAGKIGQT